MKTLGLLLLFGLVFIATGADVELTACNQQGEVEKAIWNDNLDKFKEYIDEDNKNCFIKDSYSKKTVLCKAVQANSLAIATHLVTDLKADANSFCVYSTWHGKKYTPVFEAATHKNLKMLKLLVEEGNADVAKTGEGDGTSPLLRTIDIMLDVRESEHYSYFKIIEYLVKNGANVDEIDRVDNMTALMKAADMNIDTEGQWRQDKGRFLRYYKLAKLLMDNKADAMLEVNGKTACDFTDKYQWIWKKSWTKRYMRIIRDKRTTADILNCK